jgi:hypothetical protein
LAPINDSFNHEYFKNKQDLRPQFLVTDGRYFSIYEAKFAAFKITYQVVNRRKY